MDIVEELSRNRESGANRLVCEYKAGLMALARRFYRNESDAEEAVNATFAKVVENIDGFMEQSSLFTWMCRILANEFRESVRRKSNKMEVYPGVAPDVEDADAQEAIYTNLDASLLRDAIETLPEDIKKTVLLHYFMDMPVKEVARVLSSPTSTITWRLHYARRILAAKLGVAADKAKDAVKKPGVKVTLIVLALFALTAAGAAVTAAVRSGAQDNGGRDSERATAILGSGGVVPRAAASEGLERQEGLVELGPKSSVSSLKSLSLPSLQSLTSPSSPPQSSLSSKDPTMNTTTIRSLAASAAIATATGATYMANAQSATKLWLRFDDHPAGYLTTGEDSFANAADPESYPGTPITAYGGINTWETSTATCMPVHTSGFPGGFYIFDPLSGTVQSNTGSVFLASANTNANGRSGIVAVADDAALYGDAFTAEFFIKRAKPQGNVWNTFFSRIDDQGRYSLVLRWQIGHIEGSCAFVTNGVRTVMELQNISMYQHGSLGDMKWHHVAITVDQTEPALRIYADYELIGTVPLPGPMDLGGPGNIILGADTESFGHFDGDFDEFRVSSGALTPDRFLRIQRMDDAQVFYHHSFAPIDEVFNSVKHAFRNEVEPTTANFVVTNAPASFSRLQGFSCTDAVENDEVCLMQSAAAGANAALSIPLRSDPEILTNGDFTVEMFVRIPPDGTTSESYLINLNDGIRARFQNGGSTLSVMYVWSGVASIALANDHWHHIAWVVDRDSNVKVYFDYALKATLSYAMPNMYAGATLNIGSLDGSACKFSTLWLDEVRITKTALAPDGFLRPAAAPAGGSCLVSFSPEDFASFGRGLDGTAVVRPDAWGSYEMSTDNLPADVIYDGDSDRTGWTNTISARFIGNNTGFSGFYQIPDDTINPMGNGSFTAEMFVYCDSFGGAGLDVGPQCFLGQSNVFKMECLQSPVRLAGSDASGAAFASAGITAGKWHHIAYVQDTEKNELRLYLNGKLVGSKSGIPTPAGDPGRYVYAMCNPAKDYYGCFSNAWADEVRLTRRALTPAEFMKTDRIRPTVVTFR